MNLLAPDLLAEAFITVLPDGTSHAYFSKGITRTEALTVAQAVIAAGLELARRHGYELQVGSPPAKADADMEARFQAAVSRADNAEMALRIAEARLTEIERHVNPHDLSSAHALPKEIS